MESMFPSSIIGTLLMIAGLLVVGFIIFQIVKSVLTLAAIMITIVLLYAGYLYYTGQKLPSNRREIIKHGEEKLKPFKEKGDEVINKYLKEKAVEKLNEGK